MYLDSGTCESCRYKNGDKTAFPCSVGQLYIGSGKKCGLWEKPLLIQRVIWNLKEKCNAECD